MFRIINTITFCIVAFGIIIAADKEMKTINKIGHGVKNNPTESQSQSREITILWEEDFESGANGWSFGAGWELTESSYHSETHSALSPNNDANMNATFNLLSPTITLPEIEPEELMNFGFWLYANLPDSDGDGDDYLDDYYSISLLDLGALAWHSTDFNWGMMGSAGGNNFWGGDEEVGGYLDSWIQYLDTPSISVGSGGSLSTKIYYAIESDAGATVAGSCTDGWDAANIRISADGGATWALLEDPNRPYDFECGYGWIWNDAEYDTGGSLNHLAAGWGNDSGIWRNFNADLSAYEGMDVIIRYAFGSDPAYSTADDADITGFQVDAITVSDDSGVLFLDNGDDMSQMSPSGEVWTDQFYDYGGSLLDGRPGSTGWEEYTPGLAFNGNIMMDISDFAGKDVIFRIQSRYDDNHDGGQGEGFYIDDFNISKDLIDNYPAPPGLTADAGDGEVSLTWRDMNACSDPENTPGDDCIITNDDGEESDGVLDCSGDGDCCPASWIGDSYPDCSDQAYGCDLTCYECDGGDCGDGTVTVTYNVYRDGTAIDSGLDESNYTDTGLTNNQTYEFAVSAVYPDGEESNPSNSVFATPASETVHEEGHDDGSFESGFNVGGGNFSAVRISAGSSGEDILRFKWFQFGSGGAFYIKVFEDDGGLPGAEIYSTVQTTSSLDGWNEKDLSTEGLNVSGDFWIGAKEFSSSQPFGIDTDSNSGDSYQNTGDGWTAIEGNLGYHVFLDCGDNCNDCPSAGSGDVTADGTVNVLDIVAVVTAILGDGFQDECSAASADVTGDGTVNVLDIVAIVTSILGGRIDIDDATSAHLIKGENSLMLESNGYIGGLQMTLEHGPAFSIDLTDEAMVADYRTDGNETILVIVVPGSNELFTYTGDFEIVDMIVANSEDRIDVNVINTPREFNLDTAYPNPFNPITNINFTLPFESGITLEVYDMQGRIIEVLVSGDMKPGYHSVIWNADSHSSGVYFVKMVAGEYVNTQKLMLIK